MITLEDVTALERLQWAEALLNGAQADDAQRELDTRGREGTLFHYGGATGVVKVCYRSESGRYRNGFFLRRHVELRGGAWRIVDNDPAKALMVSSRSWDTRADV